jgi:hypothetical protein
MKELDELLFHISQVFDGWHADGTAWSEWDESVRKRVTEYRIKLESVAPQEPKQEHPNDICKNCYKPRKEHLPTGLVKNWDCPVWTGEHGGRYFELKESEPEQPSEQEELWNEARKMGMFQSSYDKVMKEFVIYRRGSNA